MMGSEYDFHNENDYNESDREMKDEKTVLYGRAEYIYRIDKVL